MVQGRHWLDTKEYWFVRIRVREVNAWLRNTTALSDWPKKKKVRNYVPVALYI